MDTACSSSLSAVHMACEAIRRGDCRAAIAGGANLLLHPLHHILLSAYRVLSPDDRTRAFGARSQGFVVGEGVAAVLLRPLADALRDNDPVLAVIRGSAVNTCGRTSSYSAPSTGAQSAVIRAALRRAGLDPAGISYIEAHGTGTELGDPVEIRRAEPGLGRRIAGCALCHRLHQADIGHLEAAAGIADWRNCSCSCATACWRRHCTRSRPIRTSISPRHRSAFRRGLSPGPVRRRRAAPASVPSDWAVRTRT